jgi:hypothetical protein
MAKEVHAIVYGVLTDEGNIKFYIESDPDSFLPDGFVYDNETDEWVDDQDWTPLVNKVYDDLARRIMK